MKRKLLVLAVLLVAVMAAGLGCKNKSGGSQEMIIFENLSGVDGITCYVDGVNWGTINRGQNLQVEGDFEGDRVLRAESRDFVWGPHVQYIGNGGTYTWSMTL